MKKVMCINDSMNGNKRPEVKFGEIYNVIDEIMGVKCMHYFLQETEMAYGVHRFIPLSSIDETELVKERSTTVNQ